MNLLPDGRLVPFRCKASNRCRYCAWLASLENVLVVGLDAQVEPPTVGMTLTTHRPDFDKARFREANRKVMRWLRAEVGQEVEGCGMIEWSTGRGGRGRMMHEHKLVKGVQEDDLGGLVDDPKAKGQRYALELALRENWRKWSGGAWVVDMRPLRSAGGAVAYMVGHHHKEAQAPPAGVRGTKRMRPSQGYFDGRLAAARSRATGEKVSPVEAYRWKARRMMRENAATKAALAKLIEAEVPEHVRDEILDDLIDQERDVEALPVRVLGDGRLMHLSTGQVFDGPAAAIHQEATRAAA